MIKTKIPILVQKWLKDVSLEELQYWQKLAKGGDFAIFEKFMAAEAERRKNIIWNLPEGDPVKLAIEKAALRGGIEAIYSIIAMAKGASAELEIRSENAKTK